MILVRWLTMEVVHLSTIAKKALIQVRKVGMKEVKEAFLVNH